MGGHSWEEKIDRGPGGDPLGTPAIASHINDLQDKKADNKDGVIEKTDDYALTIEDMKTDNIFVMDAVIPKIFTLPSVGAANKGIGCILVKGNVGKLTIQASDSDKINDSSAGGALYNALPDETWAMVIIKLVKETQWVAIVAGMGWLTT